MIKRIFLLGFICLVDFACNLQTRNQMQQIEEKKVIQDQVKNLQVNRADTAVKFQEVSTEVMHLNGRIETFESKLNSLDKGMNAKEKLSEQHFAEMNNRIKTLEEASVSLNQKIDSIINELQTLRSSIATAHKAEKEKPAKAEKAAEKSSDKGPFTSAEEEYNKQNWGEAILSYMKYREQNPKGKRYAEATYKIGYSFQQLGKDAQAKSFYLEVVNRYPSSPHAKKAQAQIAKIEK